MGKDWWIVLVGWVVGFECRNGGYLERCFGGFVVGYEGVYGYLYGDWRYWEGGEVDEWVGGLDGILEGLYSWLNVKIYLWE